MPVVNAPNNGAVTTVAAMPVMSRRITFTIANTIASQVLHADGLPRVNVWVLQTAGAGIVSVQVEFADGVAAGPVPDWQPLVPPYGVVVGVPSLNGFSLGARRYRLNITSTGAAAVRYRLVGALS